MDKIVDDTEPMDIDVSLNSSGNSFIRVLESELKNELQEDLTKPVTVVNKLKVNMQHQSFKYFKFKKFFFLSFISSLIVHFYFLPRCSELNHLNSLQEKLILNIHGQDEALDRIMNAFKSDEQMKLTFFYGPTGVGKSLAIQIIYENYINNDNVYFTTDTSYEHDLENHKIFLTSLLCSKNLILIDGAALNDNDIIYTVKYLFDKFNVLQVGLHIIIAFNSDTISSNVTKVGDYDFSTKILSHYKDIVSSKYLIEFQRLSENDLVMCIIDALTSVHKPREKIEEIANLFNVTSDGCKGVQSKVTTLYQ